MPAVIAALLAAAAAIYFFVIRARNAAEMTHELMDVASDVAAAARRFGFRRRYDMHPVDSIDDPDIALAGVAVSFLEVGGSPSRQTWDALSVRLQSQLGINKADAQELIVLGRWLMNECGTPGAAVTRMSKKLYSLRGATAVEPLMIVIKGALTAGGDSLTDAQRDALEDIQRRLRVA
ncbi:MAG: hypothetical protein AAFX00_13635 [Pseudomonadota bacterium]